jgi:hypothetical protein
MPVGLGGIIFVVLDTFTSKTSWLKIESVKKRNGKEIIRFILWQYQKKDCCIQIQVHFNITTVGIFMNWAGC